MNHDDGDNNDDDYECQQRMAQDSMEIISPLLFDSDIKYLCASFGMTFPFFMKRIRSVILIHCICIMFTPLLS